MFVRGASSPCVFCGSHLIDTAAVCHRAYAGLGLQLKLSFNLRRIWGMAEARISVGPGLLCSIKPSRSSKVSSYNEPRLRQLRANIPHNTACILIADCERVFVHVCMERMCT